jgi:surfactin synthase thioesterase subunit
VPGAEPTEADILQLLQPEADAGARGSSERKALLLSALHDWVGADIKADHSFFRSTLHRYLQLATDLPPLASTPLTACLGCDDGTLSPEEVMPWVRVAAKGAFEFQLLPGSHLLFAEQPFIQWLTERIHAKS